MRPRPTSDRMNFMFQTTVFVFGSLSKRARKEIIENASFSCEIVFTFGILRILFYFCKVKKKTSNQFTYTVATEAINIICYTFNCSILTNRNRYVASISYTCMRAHIRSQ